MPSPFCPAGELDALHGTLSGPAARRLCLRARDLFDEPPLRAPRLDYSVRRRGRARRLVRKAQRIPFRHRRRLHYALWLKRRVGDRVDGAPVIGPDTVMAMTPEPPKDAAPKDAAPSSGRIR